MFPKSRTKPTLHTTAKIGYTKPSTRGSYFYSANSVFLLQKLKSPYINFCDPVQQIIADNKDRKNNVYTNITDIRLSYFTLAATRQCLFNTTVLFIICQRNNMTAMYLGRTTLTISQSRSHLPNEINTTLSPPCGKV